MGRAAIFLPIIFYFITAWNDLFTPMIFLQSMDKRTVMVALAALMGRYTGAPTLQFAGLLLSAIPALLVYILFQRQIIRGLSVGRDQVGVGHDLSRTSARRPELREPDRVPLDLGGSIMSGIMAQPLDRLRRHLGLEARPVRVYEVFQMLGEVELDVVERLGMRRAARGAAVQFFGLRREGWKPWRLWDGTEVLMPREFAIEVDAAPAGGSCTAAATRPSPWRGACRRNGFYFDMPALTGEPLRVLPAAVEQVRREHSLGPAELEFLPPGPSTCAAPRTRPCSWAAGTSSACPGWAASRISWC